MFTAILIAARRLNRQMQIGQSSSISRPTMVSVLRGFSISLFSMASYSQNEKIHAISDPMVRYAIMNVIAIPALIGLL